MLSSIRTAADAQHDERPVRPIHRLVLHRRVPPGVDEEDVVRRGEVESRAGRLQVSLLSLLSLVLLLLLLLLVVVVVVVVTVVVVVVLLLLLLLLLLLPLSIL